MWPLADPTDPSSGVSRSALFFRTLFVTLRLVDSNGSVSSAMHDLFSYEQVVTVVTSLISLSFPVVTGKS
jgi:hypothetical protein